MTITLQQQIEIICKSAGVDQRPISEYVEPLRCDECHEQKDEVKFQGDICADCAEDFGRGYKIRQMAGRCANGAERDHGARWHAINAYTGKALCGSAPGRRSVGWSMYRGKEVTCPQCKKVIESAGRRAKLAAEQHSAKVTQC